MVKKLLTALKKYTTDGIKTPSKRAIQKTAEVTGDLIGNKIADKGTSVSRKSWKQFQNNETEEDVERATPKKRYISSEERQKLIDELRLVSNLCDYADAYILGNGRITITGTGDHGAARQAHERDKGVTFKNCAPHTKCVSIINNARDINIVMPMYKLIEYSDNYSKTSGGL